jgi:hypothetical protein
MPAAAPLDVDLVLLLLGASYHAGYSGLVCVVFSSLSTSFIRPF